MDPISTFPTFEELAFLKGTATKAAEPEPAPVANALPCVADAVACDIAGASTRYSPEIKKEAINDIMARKAFGLKKYGMALQPFNGRDALNDLKQELIDAAKYAKVLEYEEALKGTAVSGEWPSPRSKMGELYNGVVTLLLNLYQIAQPEREKTDGPHAE